MRNWCDSNVSSYSLFPYLRCIVCLIFYLLRSIHLITNCETGEERKIRCCTLFPDIFTFSILFFNITSAQVQRRNVSFACEAPFDDERGRREAKIKLYTGYTKKVPNVCRLRSGKRRHCPGWHDVFHVEYDFYISSTFVQ